MTMLDLRDALDAIPTSIATGRLVEAVGPVLQAELPAVPIGAIASVAPGTRCEVVGFRGGRALLMPLEPVSGLSYGAAVRVEEPFLRVPIGDGLFGRVIDGLGRPIDGGPPLRADSWRIVRADPPAPMERPPIQMPAPTQVRVIDAMLPIGIGQRVCIVAGSGVGKSTLLGMLARGVKADVCVVCLVGERGREVREFVERDLAGRLDRSVVLAVTSDQSPALQVRAPFAATAIAESFRDRGAHVLLLVDSLTRLAHAQRQIGLASGEPPTTRGFTPSVFALLPALFERAGPSPKGAITAFYTVLVEADDANDPIADAARGIVDGHIVLSRRIASRGQWPAIDVLASLSRLIDRVAEPRHLALATRARRLMATWADNEELVRLGAYRRGTSPEVDEALALVPRLFELFQQSPRNLAPTETTLADLAAILGG